MQVQACTVNTIPFSRSLLRAIIEHMAQMAVAFAAPDFSSDHSVRRISLFRDLRTLDFIPERWPSAPTVKFSLRTEESNITDNTMVHTIFLDFVILV